MKTDAGVASKTIVITGVSRGLAKLLRANRPSLSEIQTAIAEMKSRRTVLNPPGKPRRRIKDLITNGRP